MYKYIAHSKLAATKWVKYCKNGLIDYHITIISKYKSFFIMRTKIMAPLFIFIELARNKKETYFKVPWVNSIFHLNCQF